MPRNPEMTGLPPAPTWFDRTSKRLYGDVLLGLIEWQNAVSEEEAAHIVDYVDARSRLTSLRVLLAAELAKPDSAERTGRILALSKAVDATVKLTRDLARGLHLEEIDRDRRQHEESAEED